MGGRKAFTEQQFFWDRVEKTKDCWNWIGRKAKGYGQLSAKGKIIYAHRWSYERFVGEIPEGLTIHHKCNNPSCVNPDHLKPLTQRDNNFESEKYTGNATHCPKGHKYTAKNTYERPNKTRNGKLLKSWRECKQCIYDRSLAFKNKLKESNPEEYRRRVNANNWKRRGTPQYMK